MSGFKICLFTLIGCMLASAAMADIYEWTDADGVKHYSNYAPPENSRIMMKTNEEPYDEAADRARAEEDRQALLELTRLEIAQREAELAQREAEAERKMTEADRLAEETLQDAESYIEEAENSQTTYEGYGIGCSGYYYGCRDPLYGRWYYRNDSAGIFFKKPPHPSPYHYPRYTKRSGSPYRSGSRNQSQTGIYYRPNGYRYDNSLNLRGGNIPGGDRIGPRSGGNYGQGRLGARGSAIGRHR
jgi:hypothetical protein